MNLNTKVSKVTAVFIPAALVALFTLAFFLFPRTSILIAAYAAGLFGCALFCAGNLYFIGGKKATHGLPPSL